MLTLEALVSKVTQDCKHAVMHTPKQTDTAAGTGTPPVGGCTVDLTPTCAVTSCMPCDALPPSLRILPDGPALRFSPCITNLMPVSLRHHVSKVSLVDEHYAHATCLPYAANGQLPIRSYACSPPYVLSPPHRAATHPPPCMPACPLPASSYAAAISRCVDCTYI